MVLFTAKRSNEKKTVTESWAAHRQQSKVGTLNVCWTLQKGLRRWIRFSIKYFDLEIFVLFSIISASMIEFFLALLHAKMLRKISRKSEKKIIQGLSANSLALFGDVKRKKNWKKSKSMFLAFIVEALLITKQNTLKAIACGHMISEVYKSRYGKSSHKLKR